jgi:hypothetical protein
VRGLSTPARSPLRQQVLHSPEDFGRSHIEHLCQQHYCPNRGTAKSALHQADVGAIKSGGQPQLLLGDIARFSKFPKCLPKGFHWAGLRPDLSEARLRQSPSMLQRCQLFSHGQWSEFRPGRAQFSQDSRPHRWIRILPGSFRCRLIAKGLLIQQHLERAIRFWSVMFLQNNVSPVRN